MTYCKRCLFPDTKPGIKFRDGVCSPCLNHEKEVNWDQRLEKLKNICKEFKGTSGYDCLIPVSGGKNSHFQVYTMKSLGMNPLLVTIDNLSWTDVGRENFYNLSEAFGCDIYTYTMARDEQKSFTRKHFLLKAEPAWWWEKLVTTVPHEIAEKFDIKLVVYGEDNSYLYSGGEERVFGKAVKDVPGMFIKTYNTFPIFLSYFIKWSSYRQYGIAKSFGFKPINVKREGFIEDYAQVDTIGYNINGWLKYPKFGYGRATEVVCEWIREGRIDREQGIHLVKEHDHKLDRTMLKDFLDFSELTEREFWRTVDKLWNKDVFKKPWVLDKPIGGRNEL